MAGHHAIVGIRRRHQHSRVVRPAVDVVIGRIGPQYPPIRLTVGIAVIVHPVAPGGETIEAQHVHHAHLRHCRREQIGALVGYRADQQAAVRTAVDRQPVLRGDTLRLEILTRRNEIVEHVLLVRTSARIVPLAPVFAAAAQVRQHISTARLDPGHARRRERWGQRNVKAAVAIKHRRHRLAAHRHILTAHDEHRNLRAIL